jgi:hypothetical protein
MSIALLCFLVLMHQAPPPAPPESLREYMGMVMTYYQKPDAAKLKAFAAAFFKPETVSHPFFAAKPDVQQNVAVFFGIVGQGAPELVRHYEALWDQTSDPGRRLLITVLRGCGDEKTLAALANWQQGVSPILAKELEQLAVSLKSEKRPRPSDQPARTPQDLDQCWMQFFATGQFEGPARVLDAIDGDNLVMSETAKWSFKSLCTQHPQLAKLAKDALGKRQGASKQFLEEILSK